MVQTGFLEDSDELLEQGAENFAEPAKKEEAKGSSNGNFNEFDGTFHHNNGARYFPDGNKANGVNNWLNQETPANAANVTGPINQFDGTIHKDGQRYFPDGKKVDGVNLWLNQNKENSTVAANVTGEINEFDGTIHKDGKRYFPEGDEVKGVNLRLPQNNLLQNEEEVSLRLTHIPKIRSFAQIV